MRVLLQRVSGASVAVEGRVIGRISKGLLLLIGFGIGDNDTILAPMAQKLCSMRVFEGDQSKFHLSLLDIKGGALLVPQFTLYAETKKGRRPDFINALEPAIASPLFDKFAAAMRAAGVETVETGEFGAHMSVTLENDGPVTLMLELTPNTFSQRR